MFKKLNIKDRYTDCKYCSYVGCCNARLNHGELLGHWVWVVQFYKSKLSLTKAYKRLENKLTALDYSKITDVEVEGIDFKDYPDFCDAFIARADYKGKPMTDAQLERLNQDYDYLYNRIVERIY